MTSPEIIAGADAFAADGDRRGALVLHGFTGNPGSMRGIAEALAAEGFTVELPRLPGHGTTVEDMLTTTWADWTAEVESAYQRLAAKTDSIVVVGLSMGGALTAWTAIAHPTIAGAVFINAVVEPSEEMLGLINSLVDAGETVMAGIGSDLADPEAVETAYADTPLVPLQSLFNAVVDLQAGLAGVDAPALIMNSPEDHVVPPSNSDHLAGIWAGPVERISLDRSYHVATLDYDKDLINDAVVAFATRVSA